MIDWNKYIGIPYEHLGRGWGGVDCYGLVILVYHEEYNIKLVPFEYDMAWQEHPEEEDPINKYRGADVWKEVSLADIQEGDVLLFRVGSCPVVNHIGLYIGQGYFLHTCADMPVVAARLDEVWKSKLEQVVRHVSFS